ncbi:MAG TPA: DUF1801 domain-containing protein [Sphingomonadaceae bacterium]|nr:DUF1801 domain-containing protein [Sphingomonadaceae bacterium]
MAAAKAETPEAWIARLPPDRVATLGGVRDLVNAALPPGYAERVSGSMLVWEVPLARYPDTYNKQPLMLAALAAQKNHNALYLVCAYTDPASDAALRDAYARAGRKIDMGKSCLRFRGREDVLDDAVTQIIAETTVETLIAGYEASRR